MKKIVLAALVLLGALCTAHAEAKDKEDYKFLISITRATGKQELIYTDLYVLSGAATASSVTVGGKSVGSGEEACDSHMKVAVKGTDGLFVSLDDNEVTPLYDLHRSWDIAWNDQLTILSQTHKRLFTVTMLKCPFPLIMMVPDKEEF
jgi:hypothetical protein